MWRKRTELILGTRQLEILSQKKVLIVGLGGVGGSAVEHLCRLGVGQMGICDGDVVQPSNRNRQLIALTSTQSVNKATAWSERLTFINPDVKLKVYDRYLEISGIHELLDENWDCVVDAIDAISVKVALIEACVKRQIPLVSSMGSGNRMDPSLVRICDIDETRGDKLAKQVRKHLHKKGIRTGITVVASFEETRPVQNIETSERKIGTVSWMPAIFGSYLAWACAARLLDQDLSGKIVNGTL